VPEPAVSQDQHAPKVTARHLAELVASMSRFLTGLAVIPTFKAAEVGLAEWVALCALAEADGLGNKQLAKRLGVTGQRVNQVTNELADAGLISTVPSPDDARRIVLRLTAPGRQRLKAINRELEAPLAAALAGREMLLADGLRSVKALMDFVTRMAEENNHKVHPPRHVHPSKGNRA